MKSEFLEMEWYPKLILGKVENGSKSEMSLLKEEVVELERLNLNQDIIQEINTSKLELMIIFLMLRMSQVFQK